MTTKHEALAAHFQGIKEAMDQHMAATESGLRDLPGMAILEVERIISSIRKRHEKFVKQIDQQIAKAESTA